MFKQIDRDFACLFFVLMIVLRVNSSCVEPQSRNSGAGNCNGGQGVYQTFCHGTRFDNHTRETNVEKCFYRLWNSINFKWGCRSLIEGSCRCTVDSSFIFNWSQTFNDARQHLYQQCRGFTNNIMERYEGNMYLAATCY